MGTDETQILNRQDAKAQDFNHGWTPMHTDFPRPVKWPGLFHWAAFSPLLLPGRRRSIAPTPHQEKWI
jgi:hypothetical protein